METPALFGVFHIVTSIACVLVPWFLAKRANRLDESRLVHRLSICGWILILLECYKQLFYFVVVNDMHYDFWFLPFQLCSIPMYLCVFLTFTKGQMRQYFLTFLFAFNLPGALLALVFPKDMLRPWLPMTLHGFFWHGMLVYIALLILRTKKTGTSIKDFTGSCLIYLLCAAIAFGLNIALRPYAIYGSMPNYFYVSPYQITTQFGFSWIARNFDIPVEIVLYLLFYCLSAYLFFRFAQRKKTA